MSKDDLKDFLDKLKLERYYEILFDAGYESNEDIITMELDDIKDYDIKIPHRKRILAEVEKLKKMNEEAENSNKSPNEQNKTETVEITQIIKQDTPNPTIIPNNIQSEAPKKDESHMIAKIENFEKSYKSPQKIETNETSKINDILSNPNAITKIVLNPGSSENKPIDMNILSTFSKPIEIKSTPMNINTPTPNTNTSNTHNSPTPNPNIFDLGLIQNILSNTPNPNQIIPTHTISSPILNLYPPINFNQQNSISRSIKEPNTTQVKEKRKLDQQELKRLNGLLLNCCQMGNIESAREYIDQGADDLEKSLACASSGGHKKLALYLIDLGAKDFNKAFLSACKSGNLEMMLEMYKRGADNLQDGLREAKAKKHKNLIFQLEKIISTKDQVDPQKIEVENVLTLRQMNSLLLNYSQIGNYDMVKKYVESGANNLDKALCCACSGGQKQIVLYLIEKGAKDFDGAFLTACKSGNREMALEMIKRGAKNLAQGLEISKKRENEDMQYDIRLAMHQRDPIY